MFAFGFETRIKTMLPLINCFINDAVTMCQSDAASAHQCPPLASDKHISARLPICHFCNEAFETTFLKL